MQVKYPLKSSSWCHVGDTITSSNPVCPLSKARLTSQKQHRANDVKNSCTAGSSSYFQLCFMVRMRFRVTGTGRDVVLKDELRKFASRPAGKSNALIR